MLCILGGVVCVFFESCMIAVLINLYTLVKSECSQLNVQVQWCMTVGFGDQSPKAEKS